MKIRMISIVFLFILCLSARQLFAEYNTVTGKEDMLVISSEQESNMGDSAARQIEKQYNPVKDEEMQKRVETIGEKLAQVCDRKDVIYHFKVLDIDDINAVSLPGGRVYIFKGLLEKVKNDDELASVIAHEIGHIAARHSVKRFQSDAIANMVMVLTAATQQGDVANGADMALTSLMMAYSREDEFEADRRSVIYLKAAGYDPNAVVSFMKTMKEAKKFDIRPYSYFRTHPYIGERIGVITREITGCSDFNAWINRPLDK